MEIIFKQQQGGSSVFADFGITNCYFKQQLFASGENSYKRPHHHTAFEIHIMTKGYQIYSMDGNEIKVAAGYFFVIPPGKVHSVAHCSQGAGKYTLTFCTKNTDSDLFISETSSVPVKIPKGIYENIDFLTSHIPQSRLEATMIENRIFETTILLLQAAGMCSTKNKVETMPVDARIDKVKKYISDNINTPISVEQAAKQCYLSKKQLTRLFEKYEGATPAKYIKQCRLRHIQHLLENTDIPIRHISENMNFDNEFYFNTFFKKNCGMPPSAYRKMHSK